MQGLRRFGSVPPSSPAATKGQDVITTEQAADLLAVYLADRSDPARDALVEFHLPWIVTTAKAIARRMALHDVENCIGKFSCTSWRLSFPDSTGAAASGNSSSWH